MVAGEAKDPSPIGIACRHAKTKFAAVSTTFGFGTPRQFATEILIVFALFLVAGAWAVFQFSQFEFVRVCRGFDLWFDSDPGRTIANITSRWGPFHQRSVLHPLYSLFIAAPFGALGEVFGLRTSTVVTLYVATQSALVASTAYIAMRASGILRFDAILGVILLYSTAAGIFWIGFPEWIAFGVTAVLISIIWISAPAIRNHATGVAQNLISGSIVVTSWIIGALASLISDWPKLQWRQAYLQTRDAFTLMAALTVVQYYLFPNAGGFLNVWEHFHREFVPRVPESLTSSPLRNSIELLGQALVAPPAAVREGVRDVPGWGVLITSLQGQGLPVTLLSLAVIALWITLLALGIRAAMRGAIRPPVFVIVIGSLAFLYLLHILFGGETFLFSLYFATLMTLVALWGARSSHKAIVRVLCVCLIAASFAHNYPVFRSTVAIHNAIDLSWLDRDFFASKAVALTDCR